MENKKRCHQTVTSRILPLVGDDWEQSAETCARVERGFVSWCFWSYDDASSRSGRDPAETARTCGIAQAYGGEGQCLAGAATDVVPNFTSAGRAKPLCQGVSPSVRVHCYRGIGTILGRFRRTDEARERDCRALVSAPALVSACLDGGRRAIPGGRTRVSRPS